MIVKFEESSREVVPWESLECGEAFMYGGAIYMKPTPSVYNSDGIRIAGISISGGTYYTLDEIKIHTEVTKVKVVCTVSFITK